MDTWLPFVIAILLLILIPVVPKLLRLRVRFLRWLHWDWAANLLENHLSAALLRRRPAGLCEGHGRLLDPSKTWRGGGWR